MTSVITHFPKTSIDFLDFPIMDFPMTSIDFLVIDFLIIDFLGTSIDFLIIRLGVRWLLRLLGYGSKDWL